MSCTSLFFLSCYTPGTLNLGPCFVIRVSYLFSFHFISHDLLAAVSGAMSKSGIQFPAVRDRRFNFSLAPKKDQVFTGMWENHLLGTVEIGAWQ